MKFKIIKKLNQTSNKTMYLANNVEKQEKLLVIKPTYGNSKNTKEFYPAFEKNINSGFIDKYELFMKKINKCVPDIICPIYYEKTEG